MRDYSYLIDERVKKVYWRDYFFLSFGFLATSWGIYNIFTAQELIFSSTEISSSVVYVFCGLYLLITYSHTIYSTSSKSVAYIIIKDDHMQIILCGGKAHRISAYELITDNARLAYANQDLFGGRHRKHSRFDFLGLKTPKGIFLIACKEGSREKWIEILGNPFDK